jgi:hypothetical protein
MRFFDSHTIPLLFPIYFALLWLGVTTLLGFLSGWFRLVAIYPNQPEAPILALKNQSGSLGMVGMRGILNLSVCPSGLRVGVMRVFGPFCRDFFVPWAMISVSRKDRWLWRTAVLQFGSDPDGKLSLPAQQADRLARAASNSWPEPGPFPVESDAQARSRVFKQWLAVTGLAAAFFLIAPKLLAPAGEGPPPLVAILFPAVVFGIAGVIQYLRRSRS